MEGWREGVGGEDKRREAAPRVRGGGEAVKRHGATLDRVGPKGQLFDLDGAERAPSSVTTHAVA